MRATIMNNWQLRVDTTADPIPGSGQVLTKVLACGICGSDLHMLKHGKESLALSETLNNWADPSPMPITSFVADKDTIMGHEFCCEVVDVGPDCTNLRAGDIVVSMPLAFDASGLHPVGYSNLYNGGYADMMILNDMLAIKVPNGLSPRMAALTEPLAVGVHAVAKSRITSENSAIVIGLGPVGLAVIAELKMKGIGPIVGADFSPRRRQLALHLGADVVVDPRETPAIEAWRTTGTSRERFIFEAVGVPTIIDEAMRMAPRGGHVLVVGACMQADQIHPMVAVTRELNLQFVLGYEPDEFAYSLHAIAQGHVDLSPMLTGSVGIDGVPQAFIDLGNPEQHAKILVEPQS